MPLKFVFLALCLANVEFVSGVHYPQYEDHPARRQSHHSETAARQSQGNTKSHPQLDSPNKKEGDNHFGDWLKRRFDLIGSMGGLRRFQKGTHTLRRNNDEHDKLVVNKEITQRQNCHPIVDDSIDSGIDATDEYNKRWVTDDDSNEASSESSADSAEGSNDHNNDDNDDDGSSGTDDDDDVGDYDDVNDDNEKVA